MYFASFRCTHCDREYSRDEVTYLCPTCSREWEKGWPLPGVLETLYDYEAIGREWRKRPEIELFAPVEKRYYPELPAGNTPFYHSPRLNGYFGNTDIWLKNDGLNPSGSLKDRASQLMVAEAVRRGEDTIVAASTGNAASALAAMAAARGLRSVIFVPASAPPAKLMQIRIHGAELIEVDGDYDEAFALSLQYTKEKCGLNRNTAYHPFTIEGKKTAGLEIFCQNRFRVPDWIVVPVGDGVILTGIHKGFSDLQRAGITGKLPHLLAVQAESSAAISNYWESGFYENALTPNTIADSISVKAPSNAFWARKCLIESRGAAVRVNEAQILQGQEQLARLTGVFAEPAAAVTLPGLERAYKNGIIGKEEQVVLLITGHGLKGIGTAGR